MPQNRARAVRRRLGLALVMTLAAAGSLEPGTALGAPSSTLTRYPYLTDLVGDSVTVNWATARTSSVSGSVTVGEVGGPTPCATQTVPATKTRHHRHVGVPVPVAGDRARPAAGRDLLLPGLPGQRSQDRPARVRPVPDLHGRASRPADHAVQLRRVRRLGPGQRGQRQPRARRGCWPGWPTARPGSPSAPATSPTPPGARPTTATSTTPARRVSGVFGPRFWAVPGRSLPIFPAVGNHNPNSTFLLNWPQPQAVAGSKGRYQLDDYCCRNGTKSKRYASAWYAFDAGGARFYMLHAAWDGANVGTGTQYKNDYEYHWTRTAPSTGGSRPTWPSMRRPRSSSPSSTTRCTPTRAARAPTPSCRETSSLEGLLSRNGVDLAFNGHGHVYQRNLKPHPGSLVSYVSGGGGSVAGVDGRVRLQPDQRLRDRVEGLDGTSAAPAGPPRCRPRRPTSTTSCW